MYITPYFLSVQQHTCIYVCKTPCMLCVARTGVQLTAIIFAAIINK